MPQQGSGGDERGHLQPPDLFPVFCLQTPVKLAMLMTAIRWPGLRFPQTEKEVLDECWRWHQIILSTDGPLGTNPAPI